MSKRIQHIGIVVRDLEKSLDFYRDCLDLEVERIEELSEIKFLIAFLPIGEIEIELIEPYDPASLTGEFLLENGEGIHHVCIEVDNIDKELEILKKRGIGLIDQKAKKRERRGENSLS